MSAPNTNLKTERRRHRGPLIGMGLVVVFALGLLFWLTMRTADEGTPQETNAPQIDGRTGEETETEPVDPTEPSDTETTPMPGAPPPGDADTSP